VRDAVKGRLQINEPKERVQPGCAPTGKYLDKADNLTHALLTSTKASLFASQHMASFQSCAKIHVHHCAQNL
jgi:hypothetical protein